MSAFNHAFKQTLLDQLTAYQELLDELIGRLPRSSEESVYLMRITFIMPNGLFEEATVEAVPRIGEDVYLKDDNFTVVHVRHFINSSAGIRVFLGPA